MVRIYICNALAAVGYRSDETTSSLKRSFDSLGRENQPPRPLGGYAEVDEKITVAAALFVLGNDSAGDEYLDFVIQWLRPPSDQMTPDEVDGYWERRWIAVNSLEAMPNATKATPLLESMLKEDGAKPWVAVHVPRVLGKLTKTPTTSEPNTTTGDPAQKILDRVVAAYKSIHTYKAQGTITSHIDVGGSKTSTETSFSIVLKKPNLYLISWNQTNTAMPAMAQSGAVWNDGTQPFLYIGIMNAYAKMGKDEIALCGATGITGGAAYTIPSLFLSVFAEQSVPFARLIKPKLEKEEKVGEQDCYVVSGASKISKMERFWISKSTDLILKYYRSLEAPEGGFAMPELTDEQLKESIKGMGQEITAESLQNMRKMMKTSTEMLKTAHVTGSSTEIHTDISSPDVSKDAFRFALPEGAVLKDSLFGTVFDGKE